MQEPPLIRTVSGASPWICVVYGRIGAPHELAGRQNETATLDRNGLHRGQPCVAIIHGRRAIKLDSLVVHRGAQQRHVVFPADHAAQAPNRAIDHGQGRAVAESPYKSLERSGHQLAVFPEQFAIWRKHQRRAIERAAIAFDYAHYEIHRVVARGSRYLRALCARHIDGAVVVAAEVLAPAGLQFTRAPKSEPLPDSRQRTLRETPRYAAPPAAASRARLGKFDQRVRGVSNDGARLQRPRSP